MPLSSPEQVFRIGETGFGTGLNFLVTAYHWLQSADNNSILEYYSVEKFPFNKSQLQKTYNSFYKNWPQLSSLCNELLKYYPQHPSSGQFHFELFDKKIHLNLMINDASIALQQLLAQNTNPMNAWYLDGFSPAKNPDMWQLSLFKKIARLSKKGTTLSTFTAAGFVRRDLIEAGFDIQRTTGFGKKREQLFGSKLE